MTEHSHPELQELLARIERKLDILIEREAGRVQLESLRTQLDSLEQQQRRERER